MKVASDVLLLLCLHDFGLWVSVGLGQATAFLYSEARLYKCQGSGVLRAAQTFPPPWSKTRSKNDIRRHRSIRPTITSN